MNMYTRMYSLDEYAWNRLPFHHRVLVVRIMHAGTLAQPRNFPIMSMLHMPGTAWVQISAWAAVLVYVVVSARMRTQTCVCSSVAIGRKSGAGWGMSQCVGGRG